MKTVQAKDMTDAQWQSFAELDEFLNKEIYPQYWDGAKSDWEKIKHKALESLKISDISFSNYYYLFDGVNNVAYIEAYERRGTIYFVFNYYGKIITEEIVKVIMNEINNLLKERNKGEAFFYTFYERHYEPVLKVGAEVYDEALTSRLLKQNIDFSNLSKIVDCNELARNYELKLFHEIPEEIYDRFIIYMNTVYNDANFYHPKKKQISEFTMNDLLARVKDREIDKTPFYIYMLFDKENIAAYCSVFIETIDHKPVIEHRGGLTSVGRSYRGKSLAKYLKAKMYLKIQEDYPDYEEIFTDTYQWNKYMYRINEEFGFKPFQKGYTFRFTKEFLEKLLNEN